MAELFERAGLTPVKRSYEAIEPPKEPSLGLTPVTRKPASVWTQDMIGTDVIPDKVPEVKAEPKDDRTVFARANDFMIDAGNAAAGFVKAVPDLFSPDSKPSKFLDDFIKEGQGKQSDWRKAYRDHVDRSIKADEDAGNTGIVPMLSGYLKAPSTFISDVVGNAGPSMGIAKVLGLKAAGAVGAAAGAGGVRGDYYERIQKADDVRLVAESPEYAKLRETMPEKAAKDKISTDISARLAAAMTAGGAVELLASVTGVQKALAGRGSAGRLRTMGTEFGTEALSGGVQTFGANVGVNERLPSESLTQGVPRGAIQEGLLSAPGGLLAGRRTANKDVDDQPDQYSGEPIDTGFPRLPAPEKRLAIEGIPNRPQIRGPVTKSEWDVVDGLSLPPPGSPPPGGGPSSNEPFDLGSPRLGGPESRLSINGIPSRPQIAGPVGKPIWEVVDGIALPRPESQSEQPSSDPLRLGVDPSSTNPPESTIMVDSRGNAAQAPQGFLNEAEARRKQSIELGLTPDVRRAQVVLSKHDTPFILKSTATREAEKVGGEVVPAQGGGYAVAVQPKPVIQNRDRTQTASVAQMQDIASNPDYGRLGFSRDFANGAPIVTQGEVDPRQVGRADVATASDGQRIPVQYAVVEASELNASNDASGTPNPEYETAQSLKAIAGSGRIAGVQAAYGKGSAQGYRRELTRDDLHGINPDKISSMRHPVLVRMMDPAAVPKNIGDVSNTANNLELSPVEQAKQDVLRVDLDALSFREDGGLTDEAVKQFVRAMPRSEQGRLIDTNGQPTAQAVDRISAAIFAKAYANDELIRIHAQAQDPEARLIMSAASQVASKMSRLEGAGGLDIRPIVVEAIQLAVNARRSGVTLKRAAQQLDITTNPDVAVVLDLFAENSRSVKPVVEALGNMADFAYNEANKADSDLFGGVPRASRQEVINRLKGPNERPSAQTLENGRGGIAASSNGQEATAIGSGQEDAGSSQEGRPSQEDPLGFSLESQTPQDLEAKQAALDKAKADEAKAETKAQVDKSADSFTLTGSDSQVDQAEAAGQNNLFDKPKDAPVHGPLVETFNGKYKQGLAGPQSLDAEARLNKERPKLEWVRAESDEFGGRYVINGYKKLKPVDAAAHQAATSPKNDKPHPTDAQKEKGNYAKGHTSIGGMDISIENPAGSKRRPEWPTLKHHYGYFKRSEGNDGDQVDVFIKQGTPTDFKGKVFIVNQNHKDGTFDEHKVMLGFSGPLMAKLAYLSNYTKGWKGLSSMASVPLDEFKGWLKDGDTKKPFENQNKDVAYKKTGDSSPNPIALNESLPNNQDYEKDLFGNPVQNTGGKDRRPKSSESAKDGNALAATALRDTKAPPGEYFTKTILGETVPRKLGAKTVKSVDDLAVATSYLYKSAVERLDVVVTDESGKVLAIVGSLKGSVDKVSVYPEMVIAEIVRVPGAKNAWLSHNHPSGNPRLSDADKKLLREFRKKFQDIGIDVGGIIAVSNGKYGYLDKNDNEGVLTARESKESVAIPVVERELVDDPESRLLVNKPEDADALARAAIKRSGPGVILMDASHKIAAFLPVSESGTKKLRGTDEARSIARAASEANASVAIIVRDERLSSGNAYNLAGSLNAMFVSVLDIITVENSGTSTTSAARGGEVFPPRAMFSRSTLDGGKPIGKAQAQAMVDSIRSKWKNAPEIVVLGSIAEAPPNVQSHASKDGAGAPEGYFYKGKVVLIADQLRSNADVARVLFHEALGHYGLRGTFGESLTPILKWVAFMRSVKVSDKARAYGLDPLNKEHRLIAAEEVLAELAQTKPEMGLVRSAIAAIRKFLSDIGVNLKLSNSDLIHQFILPARRFVEGGGQSPIGGKPAFSRSKDDKNELVNAWREIAKSEDAFQLPRSDSKTLKDVAKDYDPGIEVSQAKSGNGYKSWYVTVPVEKTSSTAIVKHYDTNEFVLDIADFFPGDAGRTVYQMVGDLAHNTGGVFIGDPSGLSDIAQVRRTEAMISSALRWDSTGHLEPHKLQLKPKVGDVSGFKWKKGDTDFNLSEMLRVSSENVYKKVPNMKDIRYNFEDGQFEQYNGKGVYDPIAEANFDALAKSPGARSAQAGRTTLKRAAFTHAVLSESGSEGRGSVLGEIARQSSEHLGGPLNRVLYKRGEGAGLVFEQAKAIADRFSKNGFAKIEVLESLNDLPSGLKEKVLSRAPDGKVRGMYFKDTDQVFVNAAEIQSADEFVFVALHESFHRGLAKTIPEAKALLRQMWNSNPALKKAVAKQRADHKIGLDEAIEEALADLAGRGEVRDLKGWDKILAMVKAWLGKASEALGASINWTDDMVLVFVAGISREGLKGVHVESNSNETINVDGKERSRTNSKGQPIAGNDEAIQNFWKWFADSKVVDAEGRPLVVYHGTGSDFNTFDNSRTGTNDRGLWGRGHYFSAVLSNANSYAMRQGDGSSVIPSYVAINSPLTLKTGNDLVIRLPDGSNFKDLVGPNLDGSKIKGIAQANRHDGVIQIKLDGLIGDLVAFNPNQIKSATGNQGTFDPGNADIRFSRSPMGKATDIARPTNLKARMKAMVDYVDHKTDVLNSLPDSRDYLRRRGLAQGRIANADAIAAGIREAFKDANDADKKAIYDYLTTAGSTTKNISEPLRKASETTKANIRAVGDKLVQAGLLDPAAQEKYKDAYLPRIYLKHLLNEGDYRALGSGKKPSDMGYLKARKDLPQELRDVILGEIKNPAFLSAMAIVTPMRDVALLDFMSQISKNGKWIADQSVVEFEGKQVTPFWLKAEADRLRSQSRYMEDAVAAKKAAAMAEKMDAVAQPAIESLKIGDYKDFKSMPDTPRYGMLRGLMVRKEIHEDIVGVYDIMPDDPNIVQSIFGYGGVGTKVTQWWKVGKVTLNPGSQIRNAISNAIMLQLSGVPLHRVPTAIFSAVKEISSNGKHWQIAKKYGITEATFNAQELGEIKKDTIKMQMESIGLPQWKRLGLAALLMAHPIVENAGKFHQFMEQVGKTAKIIDAMEREGKSESEAVFEAQKWLFDYSLVPNAIRYARNAPIGSPFATWLWKSSPRLLEVAALHPQRLIPWVGLFASLPYIAAMAVGGDDDDWKKVKELMPENMKKRGHIAAVPFRDENGKIQFADLGPFFPWTMWSDFMLNMGRGEVESAASDLAGNIFGGGPIFSALATISTGGVDPFTDQKVFQKGDPPARQALGMLNYAWTLAMPPVITDQGFAGKAYRAATETTDKFGDERQSVVGAASSLLGLNMYGIDPENMVAKESQKMFREVLDVKNSLKSKLADHSLSEEKRKSLVDEYTDEMKRRQQKILDYRAIGLPSKELQPDP